MPDLKIRKPRHGWNHALDRAASGITLVLSCVDLVLQHHLWSVAWLGVSLGFLAMAKLNRIEQLKIQALAEPVIYHNLTTPPSPEFATALKQAVEDSERRGL